jgi:dynein heavy chain, axonemal
MPPLRKALDELALVNKRDIAELKALKSPPNGIKLVMEAICILLNQLPREVRAGKRLEPEVRSARFWEESMKVVSDFHFLDNLLNYDKDAMSEDVISQIKKYADMDGFSPKAIER